MPSVVRVIARLNIGGPARHVLWLHRAFRERNWGSTLVYGKLDRDEGDAAKDVSQREGMVYMASLVRPVSPLKDLSSTLRLIWLLLRKKPDIVHTHTGKAGMVGRTAAWLLNMLPGRRIKVVHTYHGHVFSGYFKPGLLKKMVMIERFLWDRSDVIITLTRGLAADIGGHLDKSADRIRVVPLGLDLAPLLTVSRRNVFSERFGGDERTRWVGWVGRLVEIKNPQRFLRLAKALCERSAEDLRFVMVGDGTLKQDLLNQVRQAGLEDRIFFTGWMHDLVEIYSGLDLMVNSSESEGTPVALLEAMTAGVPVAATDVGGTREIVEGAPPSWLFNGDADDQTVQALADFLAQPVRYPDIFRREISERYSKERLADDLERLYRGCLN